jgi:urease accessory protein
MPQLAAPESPAAASMACDGELAKVVFLLQLSDSAFPTGRYTHSYGLEAFAQEGRLTSPSCPSILLALLVDSIRLGVGPSDGVALASSHRAATSSSPVDFDLVVKADRQLTAVKLAREGRDASQRTGRALLRAAVSILGGPAIIGYAELVNSSRSPGNHAVAFGLLTASLGIPRVLAVTSELYAFSAAWVAAAVRLALTDHHTAQAVLHQAGETIASSARTAADRDVKDIRSCTPLLDVMAMRHENADLRLFAS